jgi:hypothetical protein
VLALAMNAIEAMPQGGTLTLGARRDRAADRILLTVADTGCGIAPDDLGKIFNPFFSTQEKVSQVGLGLWVSYRIVQVHGGKIQVKKDLDGIVAAHNPPYMATACAAYPKDLFSKVQKALSIRGPKFIHVLAPCPPGWRFSSEKSVEMGKLAVRSGMWILYEREFGKVTINGPSKAAMIKPIPLEEYLEPQGRFKGISSEAVAMLRSQAERNAMRLKREEEGIC